MARLELLDQIAVKACNAYSNLTLEERPTLFLEFHSTQSGNIWIFLLFRKSSKKYSEIFWMFALGVIFILRKGVLRLFWTTHPPM